MSNKMILAIDQGTTGSRAILCSASGKIKSSAYQEFTQIYPRPGWVEHNLSEILSSVRNVIRKAVTAAHISAEQIHAIGITNQRETIAVWDRATGKPVGNAIVWQDRRTEGICAALKKKGIENFARRKTGLFFDPYFSGTKLKWLFEKRSDLRRRAKNGSLCVGTIDSWILFHLTGKRVHATDFTNASRTLLFDLKAKNWDRALLEIFNVPLACLPQAKASGARFGSVKSFAPLKDGTPIHAIMGDQQAALYGQGCYQKGTSKNTYGTGCFLLVNLGSKLILSKAGLVTTIACDKAGKPVYAMEASIFMGGAAIQWLRDGLRLIQHAKETEKISRDVKTDGQVVLIPAFTGLGAPYWRPDARGAIFGLTRGTTREAIVKATVNAIAHQVQSVFDIIRKESGVKIKALKVDGGATANAYLMEYQAGLLGIPILRSSVAESTAWGAAKLAGHASGLWPNLKSMDRIVKYHKFVPKMQSTQRQAAIHTWNEAIQKLIA
jgi:glycerol kinase